MTSPAAEPPAPLSSRRLRLAALAGFWAVFLVLYTIRGLVLWGGHEVYAFPRRVAVTLVGMGLAWLADHLLGRLRPRSAAAVAGWTLAISLPCATVFGAANVLMVQVIAPDGQPCGSPSGCDATRLIADTSDVAINWSFVFAAWILLHLFLQTSIDARAAERRAAAHREAARVAELKALRYQINPHFLFNILNTLSSLVLKRDWAQAETLISDVARHFRYNLSADPMADARLDDEVAMQVGYLELERRRFRGRLNTEVESPDTLASALVPALILQPLVENAVKFGVGRSREAVTITIRASEAEGRLVLVVEDDASPDAAAELSDVAGLGIGLRNVRERLAARFGGEAACQAGPRNGGGFRVELQLPLVRAA